MYHDRPLAEIIVTDIGGFYAERIEEDGKYFPVEMQKECSGTTLQQWCEGRLTPRTRHGIMESLAKEGYDRYSYAAILLTSNGRDCSDPHWVRFKDGPQTWHDVWAAIGVDRDSW